MKAFLQSVWAGALAGAALPMILTVMLALNGLVRGDRFLSMLLLGLFPLLFAFPVVLAAALAIGLPLSAILQRANRESRTAYVAVGAATGFLLPLLFKTLGDLGNVFVTLVAADATTEVWWMGSFFGALGGAVTGNVWWKCRRESNIS